MTTAYIMVRSHEPPSCSSFDLAEKLLRMKEVEEAHVVFGRYDLVVKVNTGGANELYRIIVEDIGCEDCVKKTITLSVVP